MNHILNRPEFTSMTPEELSAHLAESVSSTGDTSLWDYARVANTYGELVAEGIAAAMTAVGLVAGVSAFAARGFNLSLPKVQNQLTAIATAAPALADACNDLKSRGVVTQTRWASLGGSGGVPTAEQIATLRATVLNQQSNRQQLADRYNAAADLVESNPAATWAEVVATLTE